MLFRFAKIIYFFLVLLNNLISLFAKRFEFLLYLKEFIELNSYKKLIIENKEIKFFVPKLVHLNKWTILSYTNLINSLTSSELRQRWENK